MPTFSAKSAKRLATCHPDLQTLFNAVIESIDCTVIEGQRSRATQNEYYRTGKSQKKWPDGKHCKTPSLAADVMQYPINWNDRARIEAFAAEVMATADRLRAAGSMKYKIRWGGDWNQNGKSDDEKFFDGPHFELIGVPDAEFSAPDK